ncbi:hypothetical protein JCM15519_33690 [Fundidesulfovibrio butyratiphilus]
MAETTENPTGKDSMFKANSSILENYASLIDQKGETYDNDFRRILYDSEAGERPEPNLRSLIEILEKERILIIAGGLGNKRETALRCGWEFAQLLNDKGAEDQVDAFEILTASTAHEDLFSKISSKTEPAIFVVTKVDPSIIGGNIDALHSVLNTRHWIVIATTSSRHAWKLDSSLEKSWTEPEESELFNAGDLALFIKQKLDEEDLAELSRLTGADDVAGYLALELGSPYAIEAFVSSFRLRDDEYIDIDTLISHARSKKKTIEKWFHHQINDREKVVAIALALFEGVDERIAFSAIEKLMSGAWRQRDTALQFIDYSDLANIRGSYFEFEDDGTGQARLKSLGDETRSAILHAAWSTHRRQVIASLSTMTELVLESVKHSPFELETLRSTRHIDYFRDSVAESLGEVALLSMEDVEPHLLTLIASGSIEAHNVVAAALRRVLRANKRDELFKMLGNWRVDRRAIAFVSIRMSSKEGITANQLIGSAVATIVGQLALEDPPNSLDEEIQRLIRAYASSNDEHIITQMSLTAIPVLCRAHTIQMLEIIPDLLDRVRGTWEMYAWLVSGAGYGFGLALRFLRHGLSSTLLEWIDESLQHSGRGYDASQVSLREKKLAVAAFSMAFVQPSNEGVSPKGETAPLDPHAAVGHIIRILSIEKHPFVRSISMMALNIILHDEFDLASEELPEAIDLLTNEERTQLVARMVDLHCYQRSRQSGGDLLLCVGEYDCPLWYDKVPENTPVQKKMFSWSETAKSPAVSSFAADVILGIRRVIERSQEAKRTEMIKQREKEEQRKQDLASRPSPELHRHKVQLSFVQRYVAARLATLNDPSLRPAVEGMFASLLPLSSVERCELLDRYASEQGDVLKKTVSAARRCMLINSIFWPTVVGLPVIAFMVRLIIK